MFFYRCKLQYNLLTELFHKIGVFELFARYKISMNQISHAFIKFVPTLTPNIPLRNHINNRVNFVQTSFIIKAPVKGSTS